MVESRARARGDPRACRRRGEARRVQGYPNQLAIVWKCETRAVRVADALYRKSAKFHDRAIYLRFIAPAPLPRMPKAGSARPAAPCWRLGRLGTACSANMHGADRTEKYGAHPGELGFGVVSYMHETRFAFGNRGAW